MVTKQTIMRKKISESVSMEMSGKVWFSSLTNYFNYLFLFVKYSLLLVLLFFLAGYERENPKIGNASIEFFSSDFRHGILLNIKNTEAYSYEQNLEKRLVFWFYSERQYQPAWTLNYETIDTYDDLITLIESAENYGLFSSFYMTESLTSYYNEMLNSSVDEERLDARVMLERTATIAAMRFMIHLATGLGNYDTSQVYLNFLNTLPSVLNRYLGNKNVREGILGVQPKNPEYSKLQRALEKYLTIAERDTMQYTVEQFLNNDSLVLCRLVSQGYLESKLINDSNAVSGAIRNFQKSYCLEETGSIDRATLKALSVSTKNKFYQVSLNLDRLRKDELKDRNSILVNIPEFRLHYYDNEGKNTQFNIIVGKRHTPTPMLTSEINRIVANPYWTVPKSIAYNEIIPKLRRDSTYLQRNGFSIIDNAENPVNPSSIDWSSVSQGEFNYWIRQNNNWKNALGDLKFLFPNKYSVYLHDTQAKTLFNKAVRAYSHGCIRVQNPKKLAQMILASNMKSEQVPDINEIIGTKELYDIMLDEPISIYIRYFTCTADTAGNIYFHPDIYSRDTKEIEELVKLTNQV